MLNDFFVRPVDFIELHLAHGYLGHSFLSPLSNKRTDQYGGSLENRMRFALEVTELVRKAWGDEKPLFVRLSATDWASDERDPETQEWKSWGIEQTKILAKELVKLGVDLIDTSSGGNFIGQKIAIGPSYQVKRTLASSQVARHSLTIGSHIGSVRGGSEGRRHYHWSRWTDHDATAG